jgi:methyltransferase (TIGR00027 family)
LRAAVFQQLVQPGYGEEMTTSVSRTASYVAFYRALETAERRRPRLFADPLATLFLSRPLKLCLAAARVSAVHGWIARYADHRAPGARASAIARTRFIDDVLRARVADGVRQLVVLGAGFDCRAHRIPEVGTASVRVFEVDRPETQAKKRARLARAATARDEVAYVPVDFLRDDVAARLASAGWDPLRPSLFIWEGVTNYLDKDAVEKVLSWIGRAAPGSTVVFTYIHAGLLDGSMHFEGGAQMRANVHELGEPWNFGLRPDEVGAFIARFGLVLRENLGADEYRARLLPAEQAGGYAFYRIAVADVGER